MGGGARARGVVKRFGPVTALDGLDLEVDAGEIVALLGPNGAGKSTFLRVLGTLVLPDAGTVEVCGVDALAQPTQARRRLGLMVGDERSLYWRLSGRANLEFFAALHGMRRRRAAARAAELLDLVGLTKAADRPVGTYSSGMRMRVSLARSMIAAPPLLLLDEPTGNLDPLAASRFRDLLTALARERGTAVLMATHDLHEAVAVADRVAVLAAGRIVLRESSAEMDAAELERVFLKAVEEAGEQELEPPREVLELDV